MSKIKISAVSYTNTKPFVYGISNSEIKNEIDLSLDIPSDCAVKLIKKQVDIGLIPIASIPFVPNAHIIGSYCIGSVGAVNSVFIFSQVPASEIRTLRLDVHSRTSNNLAKVLLKHHFKVEVLFTTDAETPTDAFVLIGDRTFGRKNDFLYAYDMGEEWTKFTGLPFMYAAWVANKPISTDFVTAFDAALKLGLDNRERLLQTLPACPHFDLHDYLFNKLDFAITNDKLKAKDIFLNYSAELELIE